MSTIAKTVVSSLLIALVAIPAPVEAHPKRRPGKKVVVVTPKYRPAKPIYGPHWRRSYHRHHLPSVATFAVISGVTYAIVNNHYYRAQGNTYVYVQQSPVTAPNTVVVNTPAAPATGSGLPEGTLVEVLPESTATVLVNGVTYYVDGAVWYAPIEGSHRFVVVAPQL
ncbi:hypothetical protein [Aliagarivorans taiwanensis]|uniref:hypothetical protein n=1 Tax=Aliagarivorans taiwanensis TaxID=561966 RepID=UPI00047C80A0|nr:hypothetical protein [Aliagarivorans taiwanensis]